MQSNSLLIFLFNSGLIHLIFLNISLYGIDFISAIIARDLSMPSSVMNGALNMDFDLVKYIICVSSTLYGWTILPLFFSSNRVL